MKFFPARWFKRHSEPRSIKRIVIHTTESSEKPGIAERIAVWSAGGHGGRPASAHFYVDNAEIVQSVAENDVAWHAAGDNAATIGIELCGSAHQDGVAWADPFSTSMLAKAAHLVAWLSAKYDIPLVKLSPADVKAGKSGICGHTDVSKAFGKSTHWDPGPSLPWGSFLTRVNTIRFPVPTVPRTVPKPAVGKLELALKAVAALVEEIKAHPVKLGDKGQKVLVQKPLRQRGFILRTDGSFGPETRKAVISFQAVRGVNDDGVVGRETIEQLLKP